MTSDLSQELNQRRTSSTLIVGPFYFISSSCLVDSESQELPDVSVVSASAKRIFISCIIAYIQRRIHYFVLDVCLNKLP